MSDLPTECESDSNEVTRLFRSAVAHWPQRTAVRFDGVAMSYSELERWSERLASGLRQAGVANGTHVGLYLQNSAHYVVIFLALMKAGAVAVNYSPLDAAEALSSKIVESRTEVLVTADAPELLAAVGEVVKTGALKLVLVGRADDFCQGATVNPPPPALPSERFKPLVEVVTTNASQTADEERSIAQGLAVLQFTGGTTGKPKAAMLTHSNISSAVSQLATHWVEGGLLQPGRERFLVALPLFHVYSMVVNMLFGLSIGAELIIHERFEAAEIVREIRESEVSVFMGVPTMFVALSTFGDGSQLGLSSLRLCNSGGAPIAPQTHRTFVQRAGCELHEGWGMTETCGVGTLSPLRGPHLAGSPGRPVAGLDVRFVDPENGDQTAGDSPGELWVRGPNVMKAYWNAEEATSKAFSSDGYFRTGDVGYLSKNGELILVDRLKDMLICGGFNVYPRVIEEAIYRHPAVEDVMVIGISDDYRGQTPKAFIKLKPESAHFSIDVLRSFLQGKLGKHELPTALEFRSQLPKTPVGKLSKKKLYLEIQNPKS